MRADRNTCHHVAPFSLQLVPSHDPALLHVCAVFVTHRDLRQVLASFRRMTW